MFRACLKVCVGGDKRAAWRKRALSFLGRAIALSIKLLKFLSSASNVKVAFTHHSFDVGHLLAVITISLLWCTVAIFPLNIAVQLWPHNCGTDVNTPDVSFGNACTILAFSGNSSNPGHKPMWDEFIMLPFGSIAWIGFYVFLCYLVSR